MLEAGDVLLVLSLSSVTAKLLRFSLVSSTVFPGSVPGVDLFIKWLFEEFDPEAVLLDEEARLVMLALRLVAADAKSGKRTLFVPGIGLVIDDFLPATTLAHRSGGLAVEAAGSNTRIIANVKVFFTRKLLAQNRNFYLILFYHSIQLLESVNSLRVMIT